MVIPLHVILLELRVRLSWWSSVGEDRSGIKFKNAAECYFSNCLLLLFPLAASL